MKILFYISAVKKENRRTQKRQKRHNAQRGDQERSPLKNCTGNKEKPNRLKSTQKHDIIFSLINKNL